MPANTCQVKLLAGVGLNAYGGVYYEGSSPYSLEQHLRKHPDLLARDEHGAPLLRTLGPSGPRLIAHACPSRAENQEFAQESLQWLFEALDLDGAQLESGDTGVCCCSLCRERRHYPVSDLSWEDMALMYPLAVTAIRTVRPQALLLLETYSHPEPMPTLTRPHNFGGNTPPWAAACLADFPENTVIQWVGDGGAPLGWSEQGPPPEARHQHSLRLHLGTNWMDRLHNLALTRLADFVRACRNHGFTGSSMFGESSPFHANAELNYLAFADFGSAENPDCDLESYLERLAAPLLGGVASARLYIELAETVRDPSRAADSAHAAIKMAAKREGRVAERWAWLANYLASYGYQSE